MPIKVLNPNVEMDFKQQAKILAKELFANYGVSIKYTQSLEILSKVGGFETYKSRCEYMKTKFPEQEEKEEFSLNPVTREEIDQEVKAEIVYILNNYDNEEDEYLNAVGCKISELTEEIAYNHITKYIDKYEKVFLKNGLDSLAEGGVYDILKENFTYYVQNRNINLNPNAQISFNETVIAKVNFISFTDFDKKLEEDVLSNRLKEYKRLPLDYTWGYKYGSCVFNTAMVILDECLVEYDLNQQLYKDMTVKFANEFLINYNQEKEANISEYRVIKWLREEKLIPQ